MPTKTTSTRDHILGLIKKRKQLTVSVIALELDITEMAVRRHLNTLERDGIVETTLLRQAMGRPTHVYQLSHTGEETFPRDYGTLAVELLDDLMDLDGIEKVEELFKKRRERQRKRFEKRIGIGKTLEEKVQELAQLQNEQGFMVEITHEEDGSIIFKEYNCPIAAVAKQFPMICESELLLFKEVLDTEDIECKMCIATGHDPHCYYKIRNTN
ncbi:helix-turn-helix transcriptional regulator [Evansella sp. AB-rgal1]|uniref:helix-turn-helix transcriptional regulator n=1 Tax=Evansella sp. AB-rgal1 TaxID=3242696 RepID=UPI00359CD432